MSGRKDTLKTYQIVTSGDMTSSIISSLTNIQNLDNIGIQLDFTGTPTGTFAVQISANYNPVTGGGNWIPISFATAPVASGAAGDIYLDINQISAPWIRVVYTAVSSTGTLNAYITAKQV